MAVSGSHSPFMFSFTVGGAAKSLYDYAVAVYSDFPLHLQQCQIQFDVTAAGTLYIGNSNVTSTMCGASLVPTQATPVSTVPLGMIDTKDVYILISTGEGQVNVIATPR